MDPCANCKTYDCPSCEIFYVKNAQVAQNMGAPVGSTGCNCGSK